MRVAIVGTRTFHDNALFEDAVRRYVGEEDDIVTGDADGADGLAREFAYDSKRNIAVFKARWDKHGIRAGPIRNQQIVDASDKLIAFWDGHSRGTADCLERARKKGIHVIVIRV